MIIPAKYKIYPYCLLFINILLFVSGCQKIDFEKTPVVLNDTVYSLTYNSIYAQGQVLDHGNGLVHYGHCFDTLPNPTINKHVYAADSLTASGFYTNELKNLKPGLLYYVRPFVSDENTVAYGAVSEIKTHLVDLPILKNINIEEVDPLNFVLHTKVESFGNGANSLNEFGHCWSKNEHPTIDDSHTSFSSLANDSTFISTIINLDSESIYYIRSYAINIGGIIYSQPIKITTESIQLLDVIYYNTATTHNTASIRIDLGDIPTSSVEQIGICFNQTRTPTIFDDTICYPFTNEKAVIVENNRLLANNSYFLRAFVVSRNDSIYSKTIIVNTSPSIEPVIELNPGLITSDGNFRGAATIIDNGGQEFLSRGFHWGSSKKPDGSEGGILLNPEDVEFKIEYNLPKHENLFFRAFVETETGYTYSSEVVIQNPGFAIQLVPIQGGEFEMGGWNKEYEKPIHTVKLSHFLMSKYEITNKQFCAFLNNTETDSLGFLSNTLLIDLTNYTEITYSNGQFTTLAEYESYPVSNVSWHGANQYCSWAGGSLPTEAQWEYAANGGVYYNPNTPDNYAFAGILPPNHSAWTSEISNNKKHPIGIKHPNELELYDLSGNVNEWCSDWFLDYYYNVSPENDPKGPDNGSEKSIRGGSYNQVIDYAFAFSRQFANINTTTENIGFRLVYNLE